MQRKLLIVDDLLANRQILKRMLCEDYDILEAADGREALSILKSQHTSISAVLLDISMPGMDGYEVLTRIRSGKECPDIPVIMITGSEKQETRIKSLALGANDFVLKPYSSEILRHCLQNNIALHEAAATVSAIQRDQLTGLYTREAFFAKAGEMVSSHEPCHYIMACFDIDKFKVINDQYGMQKGDDVLRHTADSFREGFEPWGGICCRISADNFAVLYPSAFKDSPEIIAIRERASHVEGLASPVIFAIGRYIVDDVSLSPAAMYDRAVLAASSIKGRYDETVALYNEDMRQQLLRDQEIVQDMEDALRDRQFEVWFQPQYNHSTAAMIGAEALVRWRHPTKGLISPGRFIPIFEQNGFIYALDKFVWDEVCGKLRKWTDAGLSPLPVSVNISRYDLLRPDLVAVLTGLVEKYRLPQSLLRLEITESAFSQYPEHIVAAVKELLGCGFTVEIDDFGSGYSSLNTLKDVPAQIIKLDMKFLETGNDSLRGGNIIESIVRMAKWLGMSVIAEGVETAEQADYLRSIGCYYMQGYLYARPMTAADYEAHCSRSGSEERLLTMETVDNLDNNSFWDPKSMDTLIFNSYVGGACIYEYHGGSIELLRATEKYAQVIGSAGMTVEDALKLNWAEHLSEDSGKRVIFDLEESIATKKEVTGEYIFLDLPNCPHETFLRSTMRVIAVAGDRYLVYCTNENVTAQRQAERKAREAAQQVQMMMDHMPGGFARICLMPDGKLSREYVNETLCRMRGMSAREILSADGENVLGAMHPDDVESALAVMKQALATDEKCHTVYRLLRRDGSYIPLNAYGSITRNESGHAFFNIFYTELSEQEKKDYTLKETMPLILSAIMESSENLDFAKDKDFNYICCSPAFVRFTRQKSEADVIGKNDYDFWTKEEADHFRSDDMRLFQGGESLINFTEPIPSDDEVQHYSITSKYILRDSAGQIVGLYGSGRDITDTRAALDRLQLLTDSIPGGIASYAVSPGRIDLTYFNDGFSKLFGYTREEYQALISKEGPISRIFQEDLPVVKRQLQELMAHGTPIDCTYRSKRRSGSGFAWFNLRGVLAERHEETAFVNAVLYDVSAQHEAEQESKAVAAQMQNMMDDMPGGFVRMRITEDGIPEAVYINEGFAKLLGMSHQEALEKMGSDMRMSVHPDDAEVVRTANASVAQMIVSGETRRTQYRIRRSDGSYIWLSVLGRVTKDAQGNAFLNVYYSDSGEQKSLGYMQTLPLLLSTIMEASNDFAFAKDKNFCYLCCSPAFLALAGLKDGSEVIGKTDYQLFPADMAEQFRQNDLVLLESGKPMVDFEETIHSLDGTVHYCRASKHILRDANGASIGIYGVSRDITKERSAMEQLQLVNDSIPGGLVTYAFRKGRLRIDYYNDGFCKLFGGSREGLEARGDVDPIEWVFETDRPELLRQVAALVRDNVPMDCVYRVHVIGGGYKWINQKAAVIKRDEDTVLFNAILLDVTERQNALENLRISEEENSLAARLGGSIIARFNIADRSISLEPEMAEAYALPETIAGVPEEPIRQGLIAPESADVFRTFYEAIIAGDEAAGATFRQKHMDQWRWMKAKSSLIYDNDGMPAKAIISFSDVTEQVERDTIYKKWKQSFRDKSPESYSLYRCNISRNTSFETSEGSLLTVDFEEGRFDFDQRTAEYVAKCVFEDDRDRFFAFLNVDALLADFYSGNRVLAIEYRERRGDNAVCWLRLTVDLVDSPHSSQVDAYMFFEDIDSFKKQQLQMKELSETDPLTGLLNRNVFAEKANEILFNAKPGSGHSLLMMDIDGFKLVNDVFGHGAGDQALVDIARGLRSILRRNDLLARLGGDEFVIFMDNILDRQDAAAKAKQICTLVRKSFSLEVQISASVGIALAPGDGTDFEALYKKADAALYHVKGSGRDNYIFYSDDMTDEHLVPEPEEESVEGVKKVEKKRRMLIVDDDAIDHALLQNIFLNDFIIEKARDGASALVRLRHYGSAISVVLLDLIMPGMGGLSVLEKMRESLELRSVPVIIVSGDETRETCLEAIRKGATDYITKPIDADLLRIRVQSAVSKAENERLRAKNSMLEVLNEERIRYDSALESSGITFLEFDWRTGKFSYYPTISTYLFGKYDDRGLWQILLSDMVADTKTVQTLQQLVHRMSSDKVQSVASARVQLKTPDRDTHNFRVTVHRRTNEFQFTSKLLISLDDLDYEVR